MKYTASSSYSNMASSLSTDCTRVKTCYCGFSLFRHKDFSYKQPSCYYLQRRSALTVH